MVDKNTHTYDASDIQVLEGLEPVRLRPGMYIGGTDEKAWHHLPVEILDNSIDEAVAIQRQLKLPMMVAAFRLTSIQNTLVNLH